MLDALRLPGHRRAPLSTALTDVSANDAMPAGRAYAKYGRSLAMIPIRLCRIDAPMLEPPKYSLPEIERRWLVPDAFLDTLADAPYRVIDDTYIDHTLLRLRAIRAPDGSVVYKLCKKYGRRHALANPMTNLYLSADEYRVLSALGGARISKRRYAVAGGSVDVYRSPAPLGIFEIEFASESLAVDYVPPAFVGREITDDDRYSGAALATRQAR